MKIKLIKKLLVVLTGLCACWANAEVPDEEEWNMINKKGQEYMTSKYFDGKEFELWMDTKDTTNFSVTVDYTTECFESSQEELSGAQ